MRHERQKDKNHLRSGGLTMAQQTLNIGDTGAQLVTKFNDNCTELYARPQGDSYTEAALTDNATTQIVVGDKTSDMAIFVKYVVKRGTGYRIGSFMILTNGTTVDMSPDSYITNGDAGVADAAVVFDVNISGDDIRIAATLSSTGTAATLSYTLSIVPIPS